MQSITRQRLLYVIKFPARLAIVYVVVVIVVVVVVVVVVDAWCRFARSSGYYEVLTC